MSGRDRALWRAFSIGLFLLTATGRAGSAQAVSTAASALTVDAAVREAIDHNLTLVAERYSVSVADARLVTARLRPNPVLTFNVMLPDGTVYDDAVSPREQVFRTDVLLERGGKREQRIEVARDAKSIAELQLLDTMRGIVLDVESAVVDVALAKQNLSLARESLDAFNAVVKVNTERVRTGDLAQMELARSRLAALQFQNEVRQRDAGLQVAVAKLKTLLGRTDANPIDVVADLRRDEEPIDVTAVRQKALTSRPDLRALRADQARSAADARLQIAQGKVDYTVSAEVHHQQQPTPVGAQGFMYGAFVSVPLPIFNRNQGEIARAQLEERQAGARVGAREADIAREVVAAYQTYAAARDVVATIESDMLQQARDVREAMAYSYTRGEGSFIELLDATRAFNDTMQSYNEARAELARSLYQLDSIAGGAAGATVTP